MKNDRTKEKGRKNQKQNKNKQKQKQTNQTKQTNKQTKTLTGRSPTKVVKKSLKNSVTKDRHLFIWGVSLTHPMLAFLCGEFLAPTHPMLASLCEEFL